MKHLFVRYIPPFERNKRLLRQKHKLKQRCKCINMCVTIVTKNLNLYSLMLHKNLLKNNPGFLSYQKSS